MRFVAVGVSAHRKVSGKVVVYAYRSDPATAPICIQRT